MSVIAFLVPLHRLHETVNSYHSNHMWTFIIVMGITMVIAIILGLSIQSRKKEDTPLATIQGKLNAHSDITPTFTDIGVNNTYLFIVDDINRKIFYADKYVDMVLDYSDVISVKVIDDGTIVSTKSVGKTIGKVLLGSAIACSTGVLFGYISSGPGKRRLHSMLSVKIHTKNPNCPMLDITCFNCNTMTDYHRPVPSSDSTFLSAVSHANEIVEIVGAIIDEQTR